MNGPAERPASDPGPAEPPDEAAAGAGDRELTHHPTTEGSGRTDPGGRDPSNRDANPLHGEIVSEQPARPGTRPAGEANDELAATIAQLTTDDLAPTDRRRLLGRLASQAGSTWRVLIRPRGILRWITETVLRAAPHIPIRDLETLRAHHPGLDGEALAERLVRNASRVTATVGAAGGGLSALEWTAPPALLSAPVLLSAETVAVVAVELKLLGELHEVYRLPLGGSAPQRASALVSAWAGRRGVSLTAAGRGLSASLGMAARRELRDRLLRRFGRNLTTLGPLLTGAAVGAELNRRATRSVGNDFRRDLRRLAAGQGASAPGPGAVSDRPHGH